MVNLDATDLDRTADRAPLRLALEPAMPRSLPPERGPAVSAQASEEGDGAPVLAAPLHDCPMCPRLVAYRMTNRAGQPDWFNGPVPSFGPLDASLLVVGMAPGVKGANRTGRPFTGDHAGQLLYSTLLRFGRATGSYGASADDGLELVDTRITNAVRCVPPANLPEPGEVTTCNPFLRGELQALPQLRVVLALGVLAHAAVLKACGIPPARIRFRHGALHELPDGLILADSYHVSRYNTNTGRLTTEMFEAVMFDVGQKLAEGA
jgi:uracil-DNA glycosylase